MNIDNFWIKQSKLVEWYKKPSIAFKKKKNNFVDWFPKNIMQSLGATTVLIQKPIMLLDEMLLKKILKLNITILYLPVTLIKMMKSIFNKSRFQTKYHFPNIF